MKRCVIAPGMHLSRTGEHSILMQRSLNVSELNYYTLFWDEIVIPTTKIIHTKLPSEDEYIGLGVITRPVLNYWSSDHLAEKYLEFQVSLLEERRLQERSNDWSLHQVGQDFISLEVNDSSKSGIRFEIFDALPIPNENVVLADILEFKHRHQQNFTDFHGYLDEIYERMKMSPDDPLLKSKCYEGFEAALLTIKRLGDDEWRGSLNSFNFSWGFESQKDRIEALIDGLLACVSFSAGDYASGAKDVIAIAARNIKLNRKDSVMLGSENASKGLKYLVEGYKEGMF